MRTITIFYFGGDVVCFIIQGDTAGTDQVIRYKIRYKLHFLHFLYFLYFLYFPFSGKGEIIQWIKRSV